MFDNVTEKLSHTHVRRSQRITDETVSKLNATIAQENASFVSVFFVSTKTEKVCWLFMLKTEKERTIKNNVTTPRTQKQRIQLVPQQHL